jgi:hypothetical protein
MRSTDAPPEHTSPSTTGHSTPPLPPTPHNPELRIIDSEGHFAGDHVRSPFGYRMYIKPCDLERIKAIPCYLQQILEIHHGE